MSSAPFPHSKIAGWPRSRTQEFRRWFKPAERYGDWNVAADATLAIVGLAARAGIAAAALSHGERRALEIAMALATQPAVLLLDEPLAGMGPEESAHIVALLKRLAADPRDPAGRARHGRGVRAGRPAHGDGQRQDIGERRAGGDPRQCRSPARVPGHRSGERALMTAPLLEARKLHSYYGSSHVLQGVDFSIGAGEVVALMGRNGMGKTTLLRSMLGLLKSRTGEVDIDGVSAIDMPPHKIARLGLAFVPENRGIFPTLTVRENLLVAARPAVDGNGWTFERV
jgi:ABC-type branched-subunit amino acid transport system ATPase component